MRILWITNITFPEAQTLLQGEGAVKGSGGWMIGAAEALLRQPGIKLFVGSVSSSVKKLTRLDGEKITYYLLPYGRGNKRENHEYEPLWKLVYDEVLPEVIHIHGTEFSHSLAWVRACGTKHVCVSIQGLRSVFYRYFYNGLTLGEIRKSVTPVSMVFGGILQGHRDYYCCGENEKEVIRKVHHIIGRTSWDRANTWAINPNARYHYGGETLRADFYSGQTWDYSQCSPHTIFLSQARAPIKGLHMVLKAMPLILRQYPDATIRVAGPDITRSSGSWIDLLKLTDYGYIIRKLIRKYKLQKHVVFTGSLDGDGMRQEYLRSNVFVCPSTIENSPNSLGEAQLLGVPVVASYVGGIADMMRGDEEHLYRFEEIEMLAEKVCSIFSNGAYQPQVEPMRLEALRRHDPETNAQEIMDIYREVASDNY